MNKKEFLKIVSQKASEQSVSIEEIYEAYEKGLPKDFQPAISFSIANVLSFLGGGIIVLGLTILATNNWAVLSDAMKIYITLGVAVTLYAIWVLSTVWNKLSVLRYVALFGSGILYPTGLVISLNIANISTSNTEKALIVTGVSGLIYILSLILERHPLLAFYSILNTTLFFYALFAYMLNSLDGAFTSQELTTYLQLFPVAIGSSHLLLASWIQKSKIRRIIPPLLNIAATLQIYIGLFSLTFQYEWLDYVFPLILLGGYMLSVKINNRIVLLGSALFTFLIIFKITAERFSQSLGWPISLVIIGLSLIVIGSGTYYIKKRFVDRKNSEMVK
jgi:hypothetical protein